MLATLFDVPQEDRHKLIYWSDTVENIGNPGYLKRLKRRFKNWKCFEYLIRSGKSALGARKRGDLISILAQSEATKDMPPNEFWGTCCY